MHFPRLAQLLITGTFLLAGSAAAESLKDPEQLRAQANARITSIDTGRLKAILLDNPNTLLIDVRSNDEITTLGGTIDAPNNANILRGWLEFRIGEYALSGDTPIVVYCGANLRSPLAAQTLMNMGYTDVKNYADGFFAWKKAGLPVAVNDAAPDSFLYSLPIKVTDGVWSAIGATQPPTYENSGHNNNLSFIVTSEGVVVVNAGDNYLLAMSLHEEIKKITGQPVKYVVLENEQGHAFLGSAYWKEQGVPIIAHVDAAAAIEARGHQALERMQGISRDKAWKSAMVLPDRTFENSLVLELGGQRIELLYLGPAHGPGDIVVWLPQKSVVIAGDMAFHERLLPIFEHTDTAGWIDTWDKFAALGADIVVPGHGGPTDMAEVTKYTLEYLKFLRPRVREIIDGGGELDDVYAIDQSAYAHLDTYRELARRNAGTLFRQMEFE